MSLITYSGPFIKAFHANTAGAGTRAAGNPALPATYDALVPTPLRRIYLLIQNNGTTDLNLDLHPTTAGATLKLYAGQSISLDNYNGGFTLSSYANVTIVEAFN